MADAIPIPKIIYEYTYTDRTGTDQKTTDPRTIPRYTPFRKVSSGTPLSLEVMVEDGAIYTPRVAKVGSVRYLICTGDDKLDASLEEDINSGAAKFSIPHGPAGLSLEYVTGGVVANAINSTDGITGDVPLLFVRTQNQCVIHQDKRKAISLISTYVIRNDPRIPATLE